MRKLNILIVENDDASIILFKIQLKNIIEKIYVSTSGTDAIEICKNNSDIDLILMDIGLDAGLFEMNGIETIKQIREFNKNIIIIVQTAQHSDMREIAIKSGSNHYISKPINVKLLLSIINQYFN